MAKLTLSRPKIVEIETPKNKAQNHIATITVTTDEGRAYIVKGPLRLTSDR